MNRLTPEKEFQLAIAICAGLTERQINKLLHVSSSTVVKRRIQMGKLPIPKQPAKKPNLNCCDYCGSEIQGEREADRKTRRTKHKFCNYECYGLYQRARRANDRCKRCQRKRKDIGLCVVFSLGMCPGCYNLLRNFDFDEEAAALFELNQRLKKEIRNGQNKATREAAH